MVMRRRHLVGLIVPVLLVAAVVAAKGRRQSAGTNATQAVTLIDAPTAWVAFTADYVKGYPGKDEVLGRFFRTSNGSDRLESGPPDDPSRVVFIHNIARGVYYTKRIAADGHVFWISGPMALPPDGWKPMQMTEEKGVRVQLHATIEGRTVIQTGTRGIVSLLAPSLNYHPMVRRDIATGYHELFRNVKLEEPAEALFEPPPGAEVRQTDKVGGIEVIIPKDAVAPGGHE
jgi:hypothetical protein